MPDLIWQADNAPYSKQFNDIYFMPEYGIQEAEHVFIHANDLVERWKYLDENQTFTIFECGFGTGLNCLLTLHTWFKLKPLGSLNYIAFEGYPLDVQQQQQAIAVYNEQLNIPHKHSAFYTDLLSHGKTILTSQVQVKLMLCRAESLTRDKLLNQPFDAIYMDGFSPSKNPDMWSQSLCQFLYDNSSAEVSLSTFSVAGIVKRNLQSAGFSIRKIPGYGKKREMLLAYMDSSLYKT